MCVFVDQCSLFGIAVCFLCQKNYSVLWFNYVELNPRKHINRPFTFSEWPTGTKISMATSHPLSPVVIMLQVTFVGEGFTRKAPKYERFIRPTGLRFKKAHVTHPELKATFHLDILGVKKNPSSPLYTQVLVLSATLLVSIFCYALMVCPKCIVRCATATVLCAVRNRESSVMLAPIP